MGSNLLMSTPAPKEPNVCRASHTEESIRWRQRSKMHVANEPWTPCPSSPLICAAVTVFAAVRNALSNVGGMPIMDAYCSRSHGAITLASQMCPFAEARSVGTVCRSRKDRTMCRGGNAEGVDLCCCRHRRTALIALPIEKMHAFF